MRLTIILMYNKDEICPKVKKEIEKRRPAVVY
jgi:hypothetical protein